ncbi:MAG: hypothetical protein DMG08_20040, partial [Acidobacteria bacterium]
PLGVLVPEEMPEQPPAASDPRTSLARWIADPDNPLTARVMANRIWHYHFGRGIVATPNDFGRRGARPSHPELLDYLANEFVTSGFRLKPMHRLILLSNTYRQSSERVDAEAKKKDPENILLWKSVERAGAHKNCVRIRASDEASPPAQVHAGRRPACVTPETRHGDYSFRAPAQMVSRFANLRVFVVKLGQPSPPRREDTKNHSVV